MILVYLFNSDLGKESVFGDGVETPKLVEQLFVIIYPYGQEDTFAYSLGHTVFFLCFASGQPAKSNEGVRGKKKKKKKKKKKTAACT